jgi:hypothetical protein
MLDAGVPPLLQEAIKRNLESGSGGGENEYAFLGKFLRPSSRRAAEMDKELSTKKAPSDILAQTQHVRGESRSIMISDPVLSAKLHRLA